MNECAEDQAPAGGSSPSAAAGASAGASIVAERAPSGVPPAAGFISTAAASGPPGDPDKAYDDLAYVVAQDGAQAGHAPVGQIPVDYSYRVAVAALEAEAEARFEWSDANAIANGFHAAGCNLNARPFSINAGSGSIVADAQFIVRYLPLSGGGQLSMRANPANIVLIPYVTGYRLVR